MKRVLIHFFITLIKTGKSALVISLLINTYHFSFASSPEIKDSLDYLILSEKKNSLKIASPDDILGVITINGTVSNAHCYGSQDGSINYNISGDSPPYTYQWSNGISGTVYGNKWSQITITNPGVPLTDYQVMITIPFRTGMNTDFSDIRFSNTSNTVLYSYWLESYVASTSAVFWVKIPALPSGNSSIKFSYDNPSAVSLSNGTATFEYFDDFNDRDISDWIHDCQGKDETDEVCDTNIINISGSNYGVRMYIYAHCGGAPTSGVRNVIKKMLTLPMGLYKQDVSTKMSVCLNGPCGGITETNAYGFQGGFIIFGYVLTRNGSCGCSNSSWSEFRSNPYTSTNTPTVYELQGLVEDCGEGEVLFDNYRIRKYYTDPIITIDNTVYQDLVLTGLGQGNYTITVTDGTGSVSTQTFNVNQPAAVTATDASHCGRNQFALSASGPYTAFNWYASTTGGTSIATSSIYNTTDLTTTTTYYVSGVGDNACETFPRTAVVANVLYPSKSNSCIKIYTGISPNTDSLNDGWVIDGIENYPQNQLYIFDRWGNLVFESIDYGNSSAKLWKGKSNKGTLKDEDLPDGTYFYEIRINGMDESLTGFVILNRDS